MLAVVHELAGGGIGVGELDQIQLPLVGQTLGGPDIHDAQLDAVFIDQTDFRVPDLLIDRQFLGSDGSTPPKKIADANAPTTK